MTLRWIRDKFEMTLRWLDGILSYFWHHKTCCKRAWAAEYQSLSELRKNLKKKECEDIEGHWGQVVKNWERFWNDSKMTSWLLMLMKIMLMKVMLMIRLVMNMLMRCLGCHYDDYQLIMAPWWCHGNAWQCTECSMAMHSTNGFAEEIDSDWTHDMSL